jgi:hypothetical protein
MLKPFQTYIFELQKPYEFRIKLAGTEPTSDVMEAIKNALETYQLETITAVKHLPIQEHREFPNWGGPCDCWMFDVTVAYPTTNVAIAQIIKERARINPNWLSVRNLQEAEFTDEAESRGGLNPNKEALLDKPELEDVKGAQELVGAGRITSLIAELEKHSRTFEVAAKDTNSDAVFEKGVTKGTTTNDKKVPMGNTSTMGTMKNKMQGKRGQ